MTSTTGTVTDASTVYTVGHSNQSAESFFALIAAHGIERLLDIRTMPRSRRNPQFSIDELAPELAVRGVDYRHLPGLGGLRHARKDSVNSGWRNESFRGYADYMQTALFRAALDDARRLAAERRSALLCAEAVPWRCHRSLVADALTVRGVAVLHILSRTAARPHSLTPFARVDGESITYPPTGLDLRPQPDFGDR